MQPSTSRMAYENVTNYNNNNFEINVKKIAFKKHTRFNYDDFLYNVQLKAKPGQLAVLLKDALEGLLHSIRKVLEDLKSKTKGHDRTLYLVSHFVSR